VDSTFKCVSQRDVLQIHATKAVLQVYTQSQARNQRGAIGQFPPPRNFQNRIYLLSIATSLHHFAPPEKISWLRPCTELFVHR